MLENYSVRALDRLPESGLTGRRKIFTHVKEITATNVTDIVNDSLGTHRKNAAEIGYLFNYYRGKQDIRYKTKIVRETINNRVTVNRASELVNFKTSYLLREPIQYISHGKSDVTSSEVTRLNEFMRAEEKEGKDRELVNWMHICGLGVRVITSDAEYGWAAGSPFCFYTVDPRKAYVIYSSGLGERPLLGVILGVDENGEQCCDAYSKDVHYIIKKNSVSAFATQYDGIPLIEYVNNEARIGAIEPVVSILNNINILQSCAVDSVQDGANGFDVFQNCELEEGQYGSLSIGGQALIIKSTGSGVDAKVYRIASELNQAGIQTRIEDLTQAYLEISGMPNRNGGSSTSDTGQAVMLRDGFAEAESRAKSTEGFFIRSEREFQRLALNICKVADSGKYELNLKPSDIDIKFTRNNLANLQTKTQVLCELLNNNWVAPKLAFQVSNLFPDDEEAYRMSMEYHEEQQRKQEDALQEELNNARISIQSSGQDNKSAEQTSNQAV